MKHIYLIILLTTIQFGFSQSNFRTALKGQVQSNGNQVENIVVFNINSKKGNIVKNDGNFEINAATRDTLVFSSINFFTKKVVLEKEDFSENLFIVKLELKITNLDVVNVENNNAKYNKIAENTQTYVDKQYINDEKSHLRNRNINIGVTENGTNIVRLFKDVFKLFKSKNPKQKDFFADVSFTELVLNKVKYTYFTNTLKLKDEEIRLFLVFCENDERAKDLSRYKSNFELMDFLFNKNKEFTNVKNETK